jgi:hypothetical protein
MLKGFSAAVAKGAIPRVTAKAEPTTAEMIDLLLDMMFLLNVLRVELTGKSGIFTVGAKLTAITANLNDS